MKKTHKIILLPVDGKELKTNCGCEPVKGLYNSTEITEHHYSCGLLTQYLFNEHRVYLNGDRVHICIISDEPALEGHWVTDGFQLAKVNCLTVNDPNKYLHKRVIASTDESLGYPVIPPAFIEAYVKAYNNSSPITEVSLEYDCDHTQMPNKVIDIIKTRADNTVIIHQAKNYTRDEVIALCAKAWDESLAVNKYGKDRLPSDNNTREPVHFNKFIEDNLK